jgi:CBS domain-containing protein
MSVHTVREIMTPKLHCCAPEDTIASAARQMADGDFGAMPVIDAASRRLAGVITDRDITCRITARGIDPTHAQVRQAMSANVFILGPEASIHDCVRLMSSKQVRRIPIVDSQNRVIGIVAQADLARASARETGLEPEVAEVVEEVSESARIVNR